MENNIRCLEDIYTGKLKLEGLSKLRLAKNLCCKFQNIWDRDKYVGFIDGKNIIFSVSTGEIDFYNVKYYEKGSHHYYDYEKDKQILAMHILYLVGDLRTSSSSYEFEDMRECKTILMDRLSDTNVSAKLRQLLIKSFDYENNRPTAQEYYNELEELEMSIMKNGYPYKELGIGYIGVNVVVGLILSYVIDFSLVIFIMVFILPYSFLTRRLYLKLGGYKSMPAKLLIIPAVIVSIAMQYMIKPILITFLIIMCLSCSTSEIIILIVKD